jgi:hypothetical protein
MTTTRHHAAGNCHNCGTAVSGNFCHECGQATVLHSASAREFIHEFIGHYVALEGKLWKSLLLLLFRPGRLTLEYIRGRRVRYIEPLRLYLTFSLIFFAVMKFSSTNTAEFSAANASSGTATAAQAQAGGHGRLVREEAPGEFEAGTADLRKGVHNINPHWGAQADKFAHMAPDEREKVFRGAFNNYVPYAIFFMMPFFALYLKLLYLGSGRRYGEHLLFALHANGFAFAALTLLMVVPDIFGFVSWGVGLWLVAYLPLAMWRVYGGSRFATGLRWLVLMALHGVGICLAIGAAVGFGILH